MPSKPFAREGRQWLEWVIPLLYGKPVKDFTPKEREAALTKFYEFCTPEAPRKGNFMITIFRWVIPERQRLPKPTIPQLEAFQKQARELIDKKLNGEQQCRTGLGASPNYQDGFVSMESQNPVDTAVSQVGNYLSMNWKYIKRCPRAGHPAERCRRVFVAKKLQEDGAITYCSRRCKDRIKRRERDQIAEERYGAKGPRPQEGV